MDKNADVNYFLVTILKLYIHRVTATTSLTLTPKISYQNFLVN